MCRSNASTAPSVLPARGPPVQIILRGGLPELTRRSTLYWPRVSDGSVIYVIWVAVQQMRLASGMFIPYERFQRIVVPK